MNTKTSTSKHRPLPFVALLLAWLVPGAGHVYIHRTWRGIIIFLVIGATFWSGLAVGGAMTVDYHDQRWWFAAQMLTGLHGLVGWRRSEQVYRELTEDTDVGPTPARRTHQRLQWSYRADRNLAEAGLALVWPTDTVARTYTGVAGLLNLMCVFDAVMLTLLGAAGPTDRSGKDNKGSEET